VVDVRVTLVDGKEHSVDSNEMAFRQAGRTAFQEAIALAGPVVLEPISDVDVVVPDGLLGDVLGDLNARRGRVLGTSPGDPGEQEVAAQVPESQIQRYASELRSLTGGRGRFTARHSHYDVVPTTP
jgi:elongation factor G